MKKKNEDDKIKMWKALFNNNVYKDILFTIDDRKWQYAIKFHGKIKATHITKIFKFIMEQEELADYEVRPDMTGDAVWFVFDILGDNVKIGS